MNYLTLENIRKSYGEKVLFAGVNAYINKGDKIALIARNGTGKTSLLDIIAGRETPEGHDARVLLAKGIRVGFLEQEPALNDARTIFEEAMQSDNPAVKAVREHLLAVETGQGLEHAMLKMDELQAWDQEARVKEILSRLKIDQHDKKVSMLSGGQRKRLALAKLLIDDPEFLILDEPTNHLDLDMIEWLEEYLQQPNITLLMVTHDRYFLECVCDQMLELEHGSLTKYTGNYSEYLMKKAMAQENEAIEFDKTQKLFRKELDWVRRQPKARTTKAKSRVDKFEEIKEQVSGRHREEEMKIEIKPARLGTKIVEAHQVNKAFGDHVLLRSFNYKFKKGERVGIVGPNGAGKSTFLKLLTGGLNPDTGKIVIGDNTVFGYYSQDGMKLAEDKRVIDVITDIAEYIPLEKGKHLTAASLLEKFLFSRSQQQVYVSKLSGGEKRRLYLLTILMQNPNFLILDEPTNDLDIYTLQVLEDYLEDFPGCLMIVSHDRYFLDKLTTHLFVFDGQGNVQDFNGNYSEYRLKASQQPSASAQRPSATVAVPSAEASAGLNDKERRELHNLEKEISKLGGEKQEIMRLFQEGLDDAEKAETMSVRLGQLNDLLEEKEMRWLELEEKK
jgi:ABC transport system ATP-binding/permease protein